MNCRGECKENHLILKHLNERLPWAGKLLWEITQEINQNLGKILWKEDFETQEGTFMCI